MESWKKSLKKALNGDHFPSTQAHTKYSNEASQMFAPVLTDNVSQQINWQDPKDPLLLQFLPNKAESIEAAGYSADPVGDSPSSPVPGLIHKYHGRVLLIASGSCAVNCRYCFRRHFPYGQSFAPRNQWRSVIEYIKQHHDIHEVILSGGDPLTLSDSTLKSLTDQLSPIPHIKTLRIHSRIPTVMPNRIDASFEAWAHSTELNKVMVLHTNHPNEINSEARQAILRLKSMGFMLLNQSVLLKDVNDSAATLIQLSHDLFSSGVMPYYLHLFDKVQNASHFDTVETDAIEIYQKMQARLPGYLLPKLVREQAGEHAKSIIAIPETDTNG